MSHWSPLAGRRASPGCLTVESGALECSDATPRGPPASRGAPGSAAAATAGRTWSRPGFLVKRLKTEQADGGEALGAPPEVAEGAAVLGEPRTKPLHPGRTETVDLTVSSGSSESEGSSGRRAAASRAGMPAKGPSVASEERSERRWNPAFPGASLAPRKAVGGNMPRKRGPRLCRRSCSANSCGNSEEELSSADDASKGKGKPKSVIPPPSKRAPLRMGGRCRRSPEQDGGMSEAVSGSTEKEGKGERRTDALGPPSCDPDNVSVLSTASLLDKEDSPPARQQAHVRESQSSLESREGVAAAGGLLPSATPLKAAEAAAHATGEATSGGFPERPLLETSDEEDGSDCVVVVDDASQIGCPLWAPSQRSLRGSARISETPRRRKADRVRGLLEAPMSSSPTLRRHMDPFFGSAGKIARVVLRDFCNHEHLDWRPSPYVNLILGGNGQGKSAIAKAIFVCCGAERAHTRERGCSSLEGGLQGGGPSQRGPHAGSTAGLVRAAEKPRLFEYIREYWSEAGPPKTVISITFSNFSSAEASLGGPYSPPKEGSSAGAPPGGPPPGVQSVVKEEGEGLVSRVSRLTGDAFLPVDRAYCHGAYGDYITLTREITKKREVKHTEVRALLTHFGLELTNPAVYLSQELAKTFLFRASEQSLYRFYLCASGLGTALSSMREAAERHQIALKELKAFDNRLSPARAAKAKLMEELEQCKQLRCLKEEVVLLREALTHLRAAEAAGAADAVASEVAELERHLELHQSEAAAGAASAVAEKQRQTVDSCKKHVKAGLLQQAELRLAQQRRKDAAQRACLYFNPRWKGPPPDLVGLLDSVEALLSQRRFSQAPLGPLGEFLHVDEEACKAAGVPPDAAQAVLEEHMSQHFATWLVGSIEEQRLLQPLLQRHLWPPRVAVVNFNCPPYAPRLTDEALGLPKGVLTLYKALKKRETQGDREDRGEASFEAAMPRKQGVLSGVVSGSSPPPASSEAAEAATAPALVPKSRTAADKDAQAALEEELSREWDFEASVLQKKREADAAARRQLEEATAACAAGREAQTAAADELRRCEEAEGRQQVAVQLAMDVRDEARMALAEFRSKHSRFFQQEQLRGLREKLEAKERESAAEERHKVALQERIEDAVGTVARAQEAVESLQRGLKERQQQVEEAVAHLKSECKSLLPEGTEQLQLSAAEAERRLKSLELRVRTLEAEVRDEATREDFCRVVEGVLPHSASLVFDHSTQRLLIQTKDRNQQHVSSHPKALSGGEKSCIQVAFLAALARRSNSPAHIFDEVDVFMDERSRIKNFNLLLDVALQMRQSTQCFFITPHWEIQREVQSRYTSDLVKVFNIRGSISLSLDTPAP
ncbi:chromosome segregation [Cyclospora cayetanensis]|uniref:Chromosome segregation n=1 Tax=Cyclospora cayetanensis TaxID=88456 RepID=A0A1D3CT94_9EIME|nr:chromosome segregation [Cyclospora cayetanensis]